MIYITGDTHIPVDIQKLSTKRFPEQKEMTKNDYVIINAVGDQWCAVLYEGVVGYCEKDQLEFEIYE